MRRCKIDKALDTLNARNGKVSGQIGHLFFAEVYGDGVRRRRSVWQIINVAGGITYSPLNARSQAQTLRNIHAEIHRGEE